MAEVDLAHLALFDLPVPTIVVNLSGHILYANRKGRKAFELAPEAQSAKRTLGHWLPESGEFAERLALIAASSNWGPLKLSSRERSLHCHARGVRISSDGELAVVLTLIPDPSAPFKDHARQIKQLNEQLAAHRKTEDELRHAMEVSELLKRELVHRVKNNLAVMSALLRSEAKSANNPAITTVLQEAAGRIMSISTVHEMLDATGSLSDVETADLLTQLLDRIRASFCPDHIAIEADLTDAVAHIDIGLPLALMTNELITNAIKHAFPRRSDGRIVLKTKRLGTDLELYLADNGVGLPQQKDGTPVRPRIVHALASQLGAEVECQVKEGTHWRFLFPDGRAVDMSKRP